MMPPEEHIPSRLTIIPYYVAAACSFFTVSVLCFLSAPAFIDHYFQPRILAITHLAILGWGTMMIFGASNQLVPVIAEQKLHSERIPIIVLLLKVAGILLLVLSFWNFSFGWQGYLGGGLLLLAITLHSFNLYRTASGGKNNIIKDFLLTAHAWLLVTALAGLMLLINLTHPFLSEDHLHYLSIHASIGMAGWFLQLIIGISSRLVPMFLLSRHEETKALNITYYCLNIGLVLFLMEGMILKTGWGKPAYFLVLIAGLVFYVHYIWKCYSSAMRKQMDQGMKQTFLALLLMLLPFLLLVIILASGNSLPPNFTSAYGFAFFGGFVSVLIMGQTFKTLPFIIWMHLTRPDKLPDLLPKDLFNERWVKGQMFIYLPGFLLFLTGLLLQFISLIYAGSVLMATGAGWYLLHVLLLVSKLRTK
jgi:hypothetical protein